MSYAYSRLGLGLAAIGFFAGAFVLLVKAQTGYREETTFYAASTPTTARIVSNELNPGKRKQPWRWEIVYEFATVSSPGEFHRGPTRAYPAAIDTTKKPGDAVAIRYRAGDPAQNALETGGPVLWSSYVMGLCGLFALAFGVLFAALSTVWYR